MDKKINKKNLSFSVIYKAVAEGGYVASVPFLPGCHTQGETLEDAEINIKEAISLYLESLLSRKENIPQETRMFQGRVEIQV
jgi:predicted RNase H-like HicB family nuclease